MPLVRSSTVSKTHWQRRRSLRVANFGIGMIATEYRTLIDALNCAPASRLFVTAWLDEDEREIVTFGEFRRRARLQAALLGDHGVGVGDRVVVIMPQGIPAMTIFVGAMMLGAVPAIIAYQIGR